MVVVIPTTQESIIMSMFYRVLCRVTVPILLCGILSGCQSGGHRSNTRDALHGTSSLSIQYKRPPIGSDPIEGLAVEYTANFTH